MRLTAKVKRPTPHEFVSRVKFRIWKLKQEIRIRLWAIYIDLFDIDLDEEDDGEDYSLSDEESKRIEEEMDRDEQDYIAASPRIEPRRTVLIYAQDNEHGCNFVTTKRYEKYILGLYARAVDWGMTTFIVDLAFSFGWLAFEMLLELRQQGEHFNLYIFQSKTHDRCRSFRLVPETDLERGFTMMQADYYYKFLYKDDGIIDYFMRRAGVVFTEGKSFVSQVHIPEHLLSAWGVSMM